MLTGNKKGQESSDDSSSLIRMLQGVKSFSGLYFFSYFRFFFSGGGSGVGDRDFCFFSSSFSSVLDAGAGFEDWLSSLSGVPTKIFSFLGIFFLGVFWLHPGHCHFPRGT